jgi:hypothetical protein
MNKCACGARWRINHEHSKPVATFVVEHDADCPYNKNNKRREKRRGSKR